MDILFMCEEYINEFMEIIIIEIIGITKNSSDKVNSEILFI